MMFERELEGADMLRLLKLVIVHDLGEAISGDIPAPLQGSAVRQGTGAGQTPPAEKAARERADFSALCAPLPEDLRAEMLSLFDEYEAGQTPEAILAKGFDKLETIFQHALGQAPGFDYAFNLAYGRKATARHPLLAELRHLADEATRARMEEARGEGKAGDP